MTDKKLTGVKPMEIRVCAPGTFVDLAKKLMGEMGLADPPDAVGLLRLTRKALAKELDVTINEGAELDWLSNIKCKFNPGQVNEEESVIEIWRLKVGEKVDKAPISAQLGCLRSMRLIHEFRKLGKNRKCPDMGEELRFIVRDKMC